MKYKKFYLSVFSLLQLFCTVCCCNEKPAVLVSIITYKEILNDILKDSCEVYSLIPPQVNFHNYEPTIKQVGVIKDCRVWFCLNDPFEEKIRSFFVKSAYPPKIAVLPGRDLGCTCVHEHEGGYDPHTWTDPYIMKKQIVYIVETLKEVFPEYKKNIEENCKAVFQKMDDTIAKVDALLKPMQEGLVIVAHSAFGYLCRQYGLTQISLESGGKEISLKEIDFVVKKAQKQHVKTVFSLIGYSEKGIDAVANLLDAKIVQLDPYICPYFQTMEQIAKQLHDALQEEGQKNER